MSSMSSNRPRSASAGTSAAVGNSNSASAAAAGTSSSSSTTNVPMSRPGAYAVTQTTTGPAQVLRVQVPTGVRPGSEFVVHPNSGTARENRRREVRVRCPINSGPGKTLQITIPPEPVTERKKLSMAKLTAAPIVLTMRMSNSEDGATSSNSKRRNGGAQVMTPEVIQSNEKRMEKYHELQASLKAQHEHENKEEQQTENDKNNNNNASKNEKEEEKNGSSSSRTDKDQQLQSSSHSHNSNCNSTPTPPQPSQPKAFLVTIPPNIHPGMPFTIDVQGKRYVIHCPPDAGPGKKVKIVPPKPRTTSKSPVRNTRRTTSQRKSGRSSKSKSPTRPPSQTQSQTRTRTSSSKSPTRTTSTATPGDTSASSSDQPPPVTTNPSNSEEMSDTSSLNNSNSNFIANTSTNTTNTNNNDQSSVGGASSQQSQQQPPQKLQMFEVRVPTGVEPGQPFALLANGQRVLVTCPPNVQVGQKIRFNLPVTQQMVQNIQLQYSDNHNLLGLGSSTANKVASSGWCRTIRVSDLKFQWVRVQNNNNNNNNAATPTTGADSNNDNNDTTNTNNSSTTDGATTKMKPVIDESRRLLDTLAMNDFHFSKSAYGRHLTLLKGNDARLRTGILSWVPAKDATVDSKLVLHQKVLLSYADIASIQQKPFADKLIWFEESLSKLLLIPWDDGHVKFFLRRKYLLQDSVDAVMSLSRTQLRQRWRLELANEPAVDAGGVTREWFQLVTQQLFDPNFGLWLPSANNQACSTINPVSDVSCPNDHLIYFRFLGRLMGRALLDRQLIHGHLVRSLYKHILGWPITFDDLAAQDEEYYNSLKALLDMDDDTLEAMCLDFTVTEELFGARQVVELVPDGGNIEVTKSNLVDYLEANLRYQMLERTRLQLTELLLGFFDVVPEPVLTVFDSHELELILCGLPTIDMDDWEANTKYAGRFKEDGDKHKIVKWFWEIVRNDFDAEMKARLLQFVTGTSGVPSRGFSVLQGNDGSIKKFCLQGLDSSVHNYPRAHTCFNRLDLPQYMDKGELRSRLKTAITLSAVGFDMD